MSNFIYDFFKPETIEHPLVDNLKDILEILEESYLRRIAKNNDVNEEEYSRNQLIDLLTINIPKEFRKKIMKFNEIEHKSFNEFYMGIIDYSDENVYISLKEFSNLGFIFLFTENGGKLYNFRIPEEICEIYDELLKTT